MSNQVADAIVIGGGVNGASVAFHLALAGMRRVVLVERWHLGAGATGKSGALVRMHYSNVPETQLAFESLKYFENWGDIVGGDCDFRQVGTLVFASPEHRPHLESNLAIQQEIGVNSRMITAEDAHDIDPSVRIDEGEAVAWEPKSGYADPNATTYTFARAASDLGAEIQEETRVLEVLVKSDRVVGVRTDKGTIEAPRVVVVAGAWANQLLEPVGIDLGLFPRQSRITIFRWPMDRSAKHPTFIDHAHHTWGRPIDGNCTLGGAEMGPPVLVDPERYSEAVTQEYIDFTRRQLSERIPSIARSTVRGNWACALMGSPDSRPLIGALDRYEGLYCMAGDNGTSFKTAPAIGKCLSELILHGASTTVDLTPFRPSRFAEGKPWVDEHDYDLVDASVSR
ncbi:MAG TPA: FAD-binding oxidoreductase [Thermomicrobiales bacterium]|nr:FAD-binding oxidoreductase [Thermomicrobiales bacterium]